MSYLLFKAGDYGNKGKWTGDKFKKLLENKKELDIIPFHTSEFTGKGILKHEIPIIGKFKNIKIKDDEIIADDIEIFNKEHFKNRKVDRLSVEIENEKITRVGALPEGVTPAVADSGSLKNLEFSEDKIEMDWIKQDKTIIFNRGDEMNLEEILSKLGGIALEDKIKLINATIKSLKEHEVSVAKKDIDLSIFKEKVPEKTEEEIKEEVKKEFAKEQEIKEFMEKNKNKITPAMKDLGIETLITKVMKDNDGIIEFSKNNETQQSKSKEILEKIFEGMKSYEKNSIEFNGENESYADEEIRKYKERNGVK
ncbi:hypothetical protein EII29_09810 [Leptotrichia sp. OH3620_COT-345]|uniref:hypothetical protein n=1 Tax=Leptotrichia sp. OH3620_COT-345 TaxID=2491048 RepID=UPI000F648065|nr:hypothetical protein [Leptotrichia sp. OH3620_COT-345]RRD38811.1 hypothetical protein EII29_09810 [Leptotrichia sp. OH3620_COT-345]